MTNTIADQQDTRRINRQLRWMLPLIVIIFTLVVGIKWGQAMEQSADITVMPCSAWSNGATPTVPQHTLTDACVDERGTLHTTPAAAENTR